MPTNVLPSKVKVASAFYRLLTVACLANRKFISDDRENPITE